MKLYNTQSRSVEQVVGVALKNQAQPHLGLYACGPTVYDFSHLGHLRKYTMDDVLVRVLRASGFSVNFVRNITDVGHLTSDGDSGEDKLEKGAKKYHKTVWEIAHEFEDYFWRSLDAMNCVHPDVSCRATDHIPQQLAMVIELEKKGFTYVIENDGVYFDTSKFPEYGEMARLDLEQQMAGARLDVIEGKRNATDFALWKFERPGENRAMVWPSPWAERSFPGWHIECSAMACHYLGEQFEIHTGGIDHVPVHHTNEVAQAEAAFGKKPFVKYWVHHNFLHVEGQKMSKSLGNFFTIDDVLARGVNPMALRLLFMTTHYRSEMNFTWSALDGSQKSYTKLVALVQSWQAEADNTPNKDAIIEHSVYFKQIWQSLQNDLDTAGALAQVWKMTKDTNITASEKVAITQALDTLLGLKIVDAATVAAKEVAHGHEVDLPNDIQQLIEQRSAARLAKNWALADQLREQLELAGYSVEDSAGGQQVKRRAQ